MEPQRLELEDGSVIVISQHCGMTFITIERAEHRFLGARIVAEGPRDAVNVSLTHEEHGLLCDMLVEAWVER